MKDFKLGDHVRKTKGSQWQGVIVGTYSTALTPVGYAVESSTERGSVQIYPAAALEMDECVSVKAQPISDTSVIEEVVLHMDHAWSGEADEDETAELVRRLRAIIGMPYELALEGEIARRQFHGRAQSLLADRDQLRAANQRLEGEVKRVREALEFACKSLSQVTSSDGSGHADIAIASLRFAGVDPAESWRMADGWKSTVRW